MKFFESAAKVVFTLLSLTACIAFLIGVARGTVTMDTKDFMVLAIAASSFYFSNKGSQENNYLGK